jgi:hypothetical protein
VDPQRNFPGDGDQRWFEGGDWNRGRHGADDGDGSYRPADGDGSYRAAEAEYTGAFEPSSAPPAPGPEPSEAQRRTTEAIDVGAMRRPPVSTPPAAYPPPPAYGGGPEQPLYPAAAERPSYPAAAEQPSYPAEQPLYPPPVEPPPYPPAEQALYPPAANPAPGPLGAPTAAVHTVPPPRQPAGPSVYRSRNPVVLVTLIVLTVLFEIPALRLLASATLADHVPANGVVAGTFLVLGIPVFAYGLYGTLGGGPVPEKLSAWLKQPLIYVPLGVLLFLLAALAT